MLFLMLLGCTDYSCGAYVVQTPLHGETVGGEWCGLFGTYALHDVGEGVVEVIVTPESRDAQASQELSDVLAIARIRIAATDLVEGAVLTGDAVEAVCGSSPYGVGSGSIAFEPATGTLSVGPRSERAVTGQFSHRLAWDFSCPSTVFSGDDLVDVDTW